MGQTRWATPLHGMPSAPPPCPGEIGGSLVSTCRESLPHPPRLVLLLS